jgi:hypothetical protein
MHAYARGTYDACLSGTTLPFPNAGGAGVGWKMFNIWSRLTSNKHIIRVYRLWTSHGACNAQSRLKNFYGNGDHIEIDRCPEEVLELVVTRLVISRKVKGSHYTRVLHYVLATCHRVREDHILSRGHSTVQMALYLVTNQTNSQFQIGMMHEDKEAPISPSQ